MLLYVKKGLKVGVYGNIRYVRSPSLSSCPFPPLDTGRDKVVVGQVRGACPWSIIPWWHEGKTVHMEPKVDSPTHTAVLTNCCPSWAQIYSSVEFRGWAKTHLQIILMLSVNLPQRSLSLSTQNSSWASRSPLNERTLVSRPTGSPRGASFPTCTLHSRHACHTQPATCLSLFPSSMVCIKSSAPNPILLHPHTFKCHPSIDVTLQCYLSYESSHFLSWQES